jgi:hypothetical protein
VLVLVTAAASWICTQLNGNIKGADLGDSLGDDRPQAAAGGQNILVIGSDSRKGLGDAYDKNLTTTRSDTLMLLHTGGLIGGYLGAHLQPRLPETALRLLSNTAVGRALLRPWPRGLPRRGMAPRRGARL